MSVRIHGQQTIIGTSGKFKINYATNTNRRRRRVSIIELIASKPAMSTVVSTFTAVKLGTTLHVPGDFDYLSKNQILSIRNLETVSGHGIEETSPTTYAIPISFIEREPALLVNIDQELQEP